MSLSTTSICNLALSRLGISKQIADISSERSSEANACRQWYDQSRRQTLSDFWWGFATSFANPGLVQANPTIEWAFSYRYPSQALEVRRILSGMRTDTRQSRVPFRIGSDANGKLIFCDLTAAQIEYTIDVQDPTLFDANFIESFALRLAANIAPQVTKGDPFKLQQIVMSLYMNSLSKAEANSANEEQPDLDPPSEYERARGGCGLGNGDFKDPLWQP